MREWTLTLPRQLPLWKMESRWISKTLKSNFRGQNSMACGILYIIGKLLELKCLKWVRIAHLDIWNTSYGQKKGRESNYQFDSRPEKSQESTWFTWLQRACDILLESSWRELQLCFRPHLFRNPKSQKFQPAQFQDSQSGVPGEKSHLDVGFVASHRVYYKGEGGGFPQVQAVMNLVCPCCSWLVLAPKMLQLCTNHFVWVVCRPMWVNEALTLLSPILELQHTPLPLKVLWAKECAPTPPSSVVFYLDSHLNPSRSWECVI